MSSAKVSVMMPCYNDERYVAQAIESVLRQDYSDFELVIVNDASTDNSAAIIESYEKQDPRIKLLHNKENLGNGLTRQVALDNSRGEYIAFCDSDDLWLENKLSLFITAAQDADQTTIIHSDAIIIDDNGKESAETFQTLMNKSHSPIEGDLKKYIYRTNFINMSSAMIPRKLLVDAGGFSDLYNLVDWDMWVRIAESARFVFINKCLTKYRLRRGSISSQQFSDRLCRSREHIYEYIIINKLDGTIPQKICSQIYYRYGATKLELGKKQQAKYAFAKSFKTNRFNLKALIRYALCHLPI